MSRIDRSSGILLHPTSLPGPRGMGEVGEIARRFVDRLEMSDQSWWQILPLNPPGYGGSPYSSDSAFAGNPYLIDLSGLVERGWLDAATVENLESEFSDVPGDHYDIGPVNESRRQVLHRAHENWVELGCPDGSDFEAFCDEHAYWLDDYALYEALKEEHDGAEWREWPPELVAREPEAIEAAEERLASTVSRIKFYQWVFGRQWQSLKDYANDSGVGLIGDAPIFVAMDSADVWAHRDLFQVDASGEPSVVAGVPPDYFSETGQKWGNPLYDWERAKETGYQWWMQRLERLLETVDLVRIDHFRGFDAYWEVPADAPTAETGHWVDGPGDDFFDEVADQFGELPFIAEDLGEITESVYELRDRHDLPGMKVVQFGFDGDPDHPFLPDNFPENCVAYTGTHDNDTTRGWYRKADEMTRHNAREYLSSDGEEIVWAMIEAIMESKARLAVFPAQDVLGLGSDARMNTPGTDTDNWSWRMTRDQIGDAGWDRLRRLTRETGRADGGTI